MHGVGTLPCRWCEHERELAELAATVAYYRDVAEADAALLLSPDVADYFGDPCRDENRNDADLALWLEWAAEGHDPDALTWAERMREHDLDADVGDDDLTRKHRVVRAGGRR